MADTAESIIKILDLYDNNEIPLSVARPYIAAIIEDSKDAAHPMLFPENRCGFCMKIKSKLLNDRLKEIPMKKIRKMRAKYQYAGEKLCETCFDAIVIAEFGIAVANATKMSQ